MRYARDVETRVAQRVVRVEAQQRQIARRRQRRRVRRAAEAAQQRIHLRHSVVDLIQIHPLP